MDTRLAHHILADDQAQSDADCSVISVTYYAAVARCGCRERGAGKGVQVLVQNERVNMSVHAGHE